MYPSNFFFLVFFHPARTGFPLSSLSFVEFVTSAPISRFFVVLTSSPSSFYMLVIFLQDSNVFILVSGHRGIPESFRAGFYFCCSRNVFASQSICCTLKQLAVHPYKICMCVFRVTSSPNITCHAVINCGLLHICTISKAC